MKKLTVSDPERRISVVARKSGYYAEMCHQVDPPMTKTSPYGSETKKLSLRRIL
jgi:hypothetical protein